MSTVFFTVSNDLNHDQRMHRICQTLHEAGYRVRIIGRKKRNSRPLENKPWEQVRLNCLFEKGKAFYLVLNLRLFLYLLFHRFDAVCAVDADTFMAAWLAARLKGRKPGFDAHEYFSEVPEVIHRPFVQKVWRRVEKWACQRSGFRYTVSDSLAREFRDIYGAPFKVVRNLPVYNPVGSPEKYEKFILYQGALNAGRGLEALIRAMHRVEAPLVLAGTGDIEKELRQLALEEGMESKVTFTGNLMPDELSALTRQAWVGVNLLDNLSRSYYLSLANKFFDYIQAGVPGLSMDFPEYRAVTGSWNVALLVSELNETEVADKLNILLNDDDLYSEMVKACHKAAKVYCWENEKEVLLSIWSGYG